MNEIGVIISRYWQTLKWLEDLKGPLDVYVYNRRGEGPPKFIFKPNYQSEEDEHRFLSGNTDLGFDINIVKNNGVNIQVINIEDDRGYECSTYLQHIYNKYDSLNDFNVFIQGHPTAYCRDIIYRLNNPEYLKHTHFTPRSVQLEFANRETINECIEFEPMSDRLGWLFPETEYGWCIYRDDFTKAPWWEFCKNMPDWSKGLPPVGGWPFGEGEQFVVCKKLILNHDTNYYRRIHHFVNTYVHPVEIPVEDRGHIDKYYGLSIMEGMWKWIF